MTRPAERPYFLEGIEYLEILDGDGHYLQLPKLTTAQRNALSATEGMMIYNTDTGQVEAYQDGSWSAVGGAGTFTDLTDTPSSYIGRGGDVVVVKTTEDGIETQPWPVTGTILNFFLSDDAADIGSYYYMYPTESGNGYSELTSPSLSTGDDQLLWAFVTEAGEPGVEVLALGAYTTTLFLKKTGNKDVRVYWKLFKRDTEGTETEILQSAVSDYLTSDNSQYLISAYLNEDQVLDPTDRLVLKLYANVSGTGTDVTVTLTMEGDYDSRLTINVLSSAFNLDRLSDVTISSPSNDEVLAYDSGSGKWINQAPTFLGLADTPSSYAGRGKYSPVVKDDETGLDWQSFVDIELESRTIYVDSQNGDDTLGNGSSGNPYKTVEKAISTIKSAIDDAVTVTVHLVGRGLSYPYTIPSFGRFCIGSGKISFEGELTPLYSSTSSSGTATTITETGAGWTADQYAGKLVKITMSGEDYWRLIETNTSDTLTVIGRLEITPSSGDAFVIYDWSSFLVGSGAEVPQGTIEFVNLALKPTDPLFKLTGTASVSFTRCRALYESGDSSSSFLFAGGKGNCIFLDACLLDGGGISSVGIDPWNEPGTFMSVTRSWSKGFITFGFLFGGAGSQAQIRNGTIIEGGSTAVKIGRQALINLSSPTVNGATDKIVIRNGSSYGLLVSSGAGAIYTSTSWVNYSGNGTDRYADSTAFYLDNE